ncbi:MAG TPA: cysteine--1-D-myo-inosityl 2-amino-2-deoxy-alpha-D-glucopyranoside ligase, partial [Catenuloplanes sp.]
MDPWTGHQVPTLPGTGRPPALYDSARQGVHPTRPSGAATMYVCGITPYDATHLGHAATMITFDLVNRAWRDAGFDVSYVQNVTDIDDPLLERAQRDGEDWVVLAMRETALFREDMEALRLIPPDHYVGAVESIPAIVEQVGVLVDGKAAYRLPDGTGDVYFDVSAAPAFGYESHLTRPQMIELFGERGGDPDRA